MITVCLHLVPMVDSETHDEILAKPPVAGQSLEDSLELLLAMDSCASAFGVNCGSHETDTRA